MFNNFTEYPDGITEEKRWKECKKKNHKRALRLFLRIDKCSIPKIMFACRVAQDIRPFLISGIRPDIRFRLPDIRLAG